MTQKNKEYLSKEKFKELKIELENLKTKKRKEIAEELEFAKSLGDLSENAEYHEARESQAALEDRIANLESILANAEIVGTHHTNQVEVGSTVHVKKTGDKAEKTYIIVGSEEADMIAGKISFKSPLGQALLGKKKGEEFKFKTPVGEAKYTITSIE
jgi:transcription elongation factor GreA